MNPDGHYHERIDPMTASADTLALAIREGGQSVHPLRRAAVYLVVAGEDGRLLNLRTVRECVWRTQGEMLYLDFAALRDALADPGADSAGDFLLRLACALADDRPMHHFGRDLARLDPRNRLVVARAFAIAAGVDPASLVHGASGGEG